MPSINDYDYTYHRYNTPGVSVGGTPEPYHPFQGGGTRAVPVAAPVAAVNPANPAGIPGYNPPPLAAGVQGRAVPAPATAAAAAGAAAQAGPRQLPTRVVIRDPQGNVVYNGEESGLAEALAGAYARPRGGTYAQPRGPVGGMGVISQGAYNPNDPFTTVTGRYWWDGNGYMVQPLVGYPSRYPHVVSGVPLPEGMLMSPWLGMWAGYMGRAAAPVTPSRPGGSGGTSRSSNNQNNGNSSSQRQGMRLNPRFDDPSLLPGYGRMPSGSATGTSGASAGAAPAGAAGSSAGGSAASPWTAPPIGREGTLSPEEAMRRALEGTLPRTAVPQTSAAPTAPATTPAPVGPQGGGEVVLEPGTSAAAPEPGLNLDPDFLAQQRRQLELDAEIAREMNGGSAGSGGLARALDPFSNPYTMPGGRGDIMLPRGTDYKGLIFGQSGAL